MRAGVAGFLDKNLMGIIMAGLAMFGGYITGQVTTGTRVAALEKKVQEHEALHLRQRPFLECLVRHVDQLRGGLTTVPCPLVMPE